MPVCEEQGGRVNQRRVLLWKSAVSNPSETFVRNQADSMRRWRPTLLGIRRVTSPLSRPGDVVAFESLRWAALR